MKSRSFWLLAAVFLIDAPHIATSRADIPPPRGYVEECVIEKVRKKGEFCTYCGSNRVRAGECHERFSNDKLPWTRRCQTYGASSWSEIWCTPWTGKDPPKIPEPKPKAKPKPDAEEQILPPVH